MGKTNLTNKGQNVKITGEEAIWGIHAGNIGQANDLFLRHNHIALGWDEMGDLRLLPRDREAFKKKLIEVYPKRKEGYYPLAAGQLFRFVYEVKPDDVVVYRSKNDKLVHIGIINGDYQYDRNISASYPHQRHITWHKKLPISVFSQGALYEIGSAMSFFHVKNYADEFINALTEKEIKQSIIKDESIISVYENIEDNTRAFILKNLVTDTKGLPFEQFIADLFHAMGYYTRPQPEGTQGTVDVIAHKDELGLEPPIVKISIKSQDSNVQESDVSQLYGKVSQNEFGMVITLGDFSNRAKTFAQNKSNLRLINGEMLIDLILNYYEKLDPKYKGLIPLKLMYVPEYFGSDEI